MSRIIRSNSPVALSASAASPSAVTSVAWPLARRPFSRNETTSGSSSAIRILPMVVALLPCRDDDRECRPLVSTAVELDPAAVRLGDRPDDREAQSGATVVPTSAFRYATGSKFYGGCARVATGIPSSS
jgi:hypothetical protein